MRLWSIHPKFLDAKGLTALWREGLLARQVLLGRTTGYVHHPQLVRFRAHPRPGSAIDAYLSAVWREADARSYRFDATKIEKRRPCRIVVTGGQIAHEWDHLLRKLAARDPVRHRAVRGLEPEPHPCFMVVPGPIESWERR